MSIQPYPAGFLLQQGHVQRLYEQSVFKVSVTMWFFFYLYSQACNGFCNVLIFPIKSPEMRIKGISEDCVKNRSFSFRKQHLVQRTSLFTGSKKKLG